MVTSAELCPTSEEPDKIIREMKKYLKDEGLNDLEPVSLFAEQLEKETVAAIEQLADQFRSMKSPEQIKKAVIKGIPRQAVLKPAHAIYRLQGQRFALGDRVIMVVDAAAGGVPLAMKGVVVGIGMRDIDVVWDVPFMGGETLNGRCTEYRGSTVPFSACLNLTQPQFAVGMNTPAQPLSNGAPAFKPKLGPQPAVPMQNYKPSVPAKNPVQIMRNPGRTGVNGNGNGPMQYGNAAKGIRAQARPDQIPASHRDHLQSVLTGQERVMAAQQASRISGHNKPQPHGSIPKPAAHVVKSPAKTHVALPSHTAVVGQGHDGPDRGGAGGRGAGRGRGGRGRGRGAAPAPAPA